MTTLKRRDIHIFDADKEAITALYEDSFPLDERMPYWMMVCMAIRKGMDMKLYYHRERLCAMTYIATYGRLSYIFYLAVDKGYRGHGLGTRLLEQIKRDYPDNNIILEIERLDPCAQNNDERIRRKEFYRRNGFTECGRNVSYGGVDYEVLSSTGELDVEELERLIKHFTFGAWKKAATD